MKAEQGLEVLLLGDDQRPQAYNLDPAAGFSMAFRGNIDLCNRVRRASRTLDGDESKEISQALIKTMTGATLPTTRAIQILQDDYGIPEWLCPFVTRLAPDRDRKRVILYKLFCDLQCDTDIEALPRHLMAARLSEILEDDNFKRPSSGFHLNRRNQMTSLILALTDGDERAIAGIAQSIPRTGQQGTLARALAQIAFNASLYKTRQALTSRLCQKLAERSGEEQLHIEMTLFHEAVKSSTGQL